DTVRDLQKMADKDGGRAQTGVSVPHNYKQTGVSVPHNYKQTRVSVPHNYKQTGVSVPHSLFKSESRAAGRSCTHRGACGASPRPPAAGAPPTPRRSSPSD